MGGRFGELLLLLILALVLFGGERLPGIGKALGSALYEFKKAVNSPPEGQPQNAAAQPAQSVAAVAPTRRRKSPARRRKSSR